jgi:putative transposase
MDGQYQNKYRIASARLQEWNYGWDAAYFVTICTKNRDLYFGHVINKEMKLSNIGVIADVLWFEISNHAKNIELGEFIVMPNHIHGILIFNGNDSQRIEKGNDQIEPDKFVETRHALSLPQPIQPLLPKTIGQLRFQNQGENTLSSVVGAYKSAVTKHCNRLGFDFAWQPRLHDHIIRDKKSFDYISNYIRTNPLSWSKDKFYPS